MYGTNTVQKAEDGFLGCSSKLLQNLYAQEESTLQLDGGQPVPAEVILISLGSYWASW